MRQPIFLSLIALFMLAGCSGSSKIFSKGRYQTEIGKIDVHLPYRTYSRLQIVQVEIAGEAYDFLFDTGAPMVVSPELSEKLHMKVLTRKRVHDSQGKSNFLNYVRMSPFELGGLKFENFTAIEADLKANAALGCLKIDGIVGANLMRLFYWEIDPSRQVLRMTNVWDTLEVGEEMNTINFRVKGTQTPVLDNIEINGEVFTGITFDTGSGGSLRLDSDENLLPDTNALISVGYHSFGIFGSKIDTQKTSLVQLKFGNDSVEYFPLNVDKVRSNKLLGMAFLENYRTIINWEKKKMYLKKVKDYNGYNDSAFALTPVYVDSTLQVGILRIQPKGPSENLALGDTILSINGLKTYPAVPETYCQIYAELRKANIMELHIKNKGEFSLQKKPKFVALGRLHAEMDD